MVDRYEKVGFEPVGDLGSGEKWYPDVGVAGERDVEALLEEQLLGQQGDLEVDFFFGNAVGGDRADLQAAVPGVNRANDSV